MITIEFNDDALDPALARLQAALADPTEVMRDLAELWLVSTQDRMARGVDAEDQPFAPRSPVTIARYLAQGLSFGAPLNRSGDMRLGLSTDAGADFVRIGSNAIQAAVMQFGAAKGAFGQTSRGGSIPWGTIPARPFIGFGDDDQTAFIAEIEEWLEGETDN